MQEHEEILHELEQGALTIKDNEQRYQKLVKYINNLLVNDFASLVFLLYKVDVSEKKLKKLLSENPKVDAAAIIADLMIERQVEKIKTKGAYKAPPNIPDDEKW